MAPEKLIRALRQIVGDHYVLVEKEDVIVYEVMVEDLEPSWWALLRRRLEQQFDQAELVVRAQEIRRL